jgi:glycosyltransferase involved in cell wall biosynthesis
MEEEIKGMNSKARGGKRKATIVLAPPWPRSGSGNTIAAQAAMHADQSRKVLLLLVPIGSWHSKLHVLFWRDAVRAMKSTGVHAVAYLRTEAELVGSRIRRFFGLKYDSITAVARYAASGVYPSELTDFLEKFDVDILHVNHAFSMLVAAQLARRIKNETGKRPLVLLDTHDVQSQVYAANQRTRSGEAERESYETLLRGELKLCASADALTHCSKHDFDFYTRHLPGHRHYSLLPTLHPDNEGNIAKNRKSKSEPTFDGLYFGNNNEANLASVLWLLKDVLPRLKGCKIGFVGTIGRLVQQRNPILYMRHKHMFLGEVPSVSRYYRKAKVILAPSKQGHGSSIKMIEALCAGKAIITTRIGVRGVPKRALIKENDIYIRDRASEFAASLRKIMKRGASQSFRNAELYDEVFSNARFRTELKKIITDAQLSVRDESR